MKPAIIIENVSKQYRLGNIGTGTLTNDLKRWWANIRGKEDPTLKIGMENKLSEAGGEYVWALQNINLEVQQGEILGIIGKNGAGKSTLLKILSRVTTPTTGSITMNGRVASLLEVGTGFHPELTGRENIFLNGAIMGMTKKEIKSRLDAIVDFAGVEKYIDTPVKRYSSGMYVRLAFAVAAHLEPEILIIDEVLAVGDAEFQKKAIGKMQDVSRIDGRTVLFVSHNMAAVKSLCTLGVELKNGGIIKSGLVNDVVDNYMKLGVTENNRIVKEIKYLNKQIHISEFSINNSKLCNVIIKENYLSIMVKGFLDSPLKLALEAKIMDMNGALLCYYSLAHSKGIIKTYNKGDFEINEIINLPKNINKGKYIFNIDITIPGIEYLIQLENKIILNFIKTVGVNGIDFNYNNSGFIILE